MTDLVKSVQDRANKVGSGGFKAIRPGLDASRSGMGANLALYEDVVPLMSYGLGSRRLASLAIQQLAAGDRAVAVIDELESGLEPHRAVRLLRYLDGDPYSQVFVTTHSPIVVEQAPIRSLSVVQNSEGAVTITSLGSSGGVMQALRRSAPSSLLARKVVICEGKTEHGLMAACFDAWDKDRSASGLTTSAGEGLAIQDGNGGEQAANRAEAMAPLGCSVLALIDNDVRSADAHVTRAEAAGAIVVRWDEGFNIESQVCSRLDVSELSEFIALGVTCRGAESTVVDDINNQSDRKVVGRDVAGWLQSESIENARSCVAQAANKRKWFKDVDSGRVLGEWLLARGQWASLEAVVARFDQVKAFVYGSAPATEPGESTRSDE